MTRVSDQKVKHNVLQQISSQLIGYVAGIKTEASAEQFLTELLSETEQIMLAKRLAIVVMLEWEYSFTQIEKTLKVSSQTIARLWKDKKEGKYSFVIERCGRKVRRRSTKENLFWDEFEKLILAGMPHQGRDRWKYLDSQSGKTLLKK